MRKASLTSTRVPVFAIMILLGTVPGIVAADDCCTPEATAKIAASAGFVDVVGIKLGMEGKKAMELMKTANPAFKIEPQKLEFHWDCATKRVCDLSGQKRQWVSAVFAEVPYTDAKGGETIQAYLTLPPNQQVVYYLLRTLRFPSSATPTVENVLAGLKKNTVPRPMITCG